VIAAFVAWVASLGLIALLLYHLRLRSSLAKLEERFRDPDSHLAPPETEVRFLTPSSVKHLANQINRQMDERVERIALENRQKRLTESILDQFEDGFLIVREDLRIGFANTAARQSFAHKSEIINIPVIEAFLDHRIVKVIQDALNSPKKRKATIRMEERIEKDGQQMNRFLMVEAGPLPFPMQGVAGVWVILRDESERHYLEQTRRDFVANASHELRTPLSIITGYLENLIDGDVTDPEMMTRFLTVMNKHAIRLGRIVEDMLTISKLENNSELIRTEPFDLLESAADMVEHLQLLITEKDANVVIDMPEDRSIIGDRFYWDQIFFNLIENSLKQNDHSGLEIEIRLRPDAANEHFILEISDNGVGIPSSDLPHVFKRFYRVEKTHTAKEIKGTGLGLSIVNRAIEAHGGTMTVHSQPGIRTTFQITIPKPKATDSGT
tara:strand:+ start:7763 stop:9079 length:1317 start_codon:yes stop_codon:yes gene_type:complete